MRERALTALPHPLDTDLLLDGMLHVAHRFERGCDWSGVWRRTLQKKQNRDHSDGGETSRTNDAHKQQRDVHADLRSTER